MSGYSTPSSSSPPPTGSRRRMRNCANTCERGCCTVATYFPLAFVYSLTTWAVWVVWSVGFGRRRSKHTWWLVQGLSLLGITLYLLGNWSYTVAAFTDPGSPLKGRTTSQRYSILPTHESPGSNPIENITVSSTGAPRYCKKCHTPKPDRTHHCSTCKRCVLKMDHHCPWLSTCLGLHNYKAFVLFLVYTSLFCWVCFLNSAWWMWKELFEESGYLDEVAPINIILLSVIAGIIGLVLSAFTGWHIYLCARGQTTIEKLERTRYLSGVRSRVERNRQEQQRHPHHRRGSGGVAERLQRAGEQILEFHANAVPGASRYEEGEEHSSPVPSLYNAGAPYPQQPPTYADNPAYTGEENETPALRSLRRTYSHMEADRDRDRYARYLDDHESEKMPNAFDLGWRRNLTHLFGPNPWLWVLPVCNTTGDGWRWEVGSTWMAAQEEASQRKERRLAAMMNQDVGLRGGGVGDTYYEYERDREREHDRDYDHSDATDDEDVDDHDDRRHRHRFDGGEDGLYSRSAMSMQPLPSGDDSDRGRRHHRRD